MDMDVMFLVTKGENSRPSRFSPLLIFISKGHGLKAHGISFIKLFYLLSHIQIVFVSIFENIFDYLTFTSLLCSSYA